MWGVADCGMRRSIFTSYSLKAATQQDWMPREVAARIKFSAAAEESWIEYLDAESLYWVSKSVLLEQMTMMIGAWAIQDC